MIDIHAHVVLPSVIGAAGPHGPEIEDGDPANGCPPSFRVGEYRLVGVQYRGTPFMDLDARLAAMDAAGIDVQVLSPNPLTFFTQVEAEWASAFCRRHNDDLAALVARAPDRVSGFAQLPVQDPVQASEELRRAVNELGLLGAYLPTDMGRAIDDAAHDVLWRTCCELDVPVFFHPAPDGIAGPRRDERLARFDGDLWLGFLYEETLAVATLVLGGVLDRHPALDVCISHGGGATSWVAERMEHAARTRQWGGDAFAAPGAVFERLTRLWWDAHVGGPRALASLIEVMGTDKIVAGTNLAGWDECTDPSHNDARLQNQFDRNARRLLRLPAPQDQPL